MSTTVLIVDDDPVQRRLLEAMVRRFGYEARTADSGTAAVRMLTGMEGEAVDLVNLFPENDSASSENAAADNLSSVNIHIVRSGARLRGFARLDESLFKPFFTRKFTDEVSLPRNIYMTHFKTRKY